jgi:hypothetical protein
VGSNCLPGWNACNGDGVGYGGWGRDYCSNGYDGWYNGYGNGCGNGCGNGYGYGYGFGNGFGGMTNWLGAVSSIPIDKIASFTHNALTG